MLLPAAGAGRVRGNGCRFLRRLVVQLCGERRPLLNQAQA